MIKIKEAFEGPNKAFIAYLMAGDPDTPSSGEFILAAQEAGADLIEIGIPFSDPIAEGEVIQAAALRALQAGTHLEDVFGMIATIRDKMRIPMVLMTYLNPVYVYGYERFFTRCADIGVSGVIIPDLPFEEQEEARNPAVLCGIDIITMVAPTSAGRVAKISRDAQGFIYLVSSMGVTGMRQQINTNLSALVSKIRQVSNIPIAIGFGVSTPEQAGRFADVADGVIVGSAIVRLVGQYGKEAKAPLMELIRGMKEKMIPSSF